MALAALLVVCLILFLVFRHYTWKTKPWPEDALWPSHFQGHRGYWKEGAQENTLASFQAAQRRGLKMIELDVRLSRDGVPVVFHDADLKRLGNSDLRVADLTAEEMRTRVQAPTLEAVLMDPSLPLFVNIELKTNAVFDGALESSVSAVVKRTRSEKRILFSSFNPVCIWRLSCLLPKVPRALLASEERVEENKFYLRHLWFAPYVRAHALHLDYRYVTEKELRSWRRQGVRVALWTVNEEALAEVFLKAGALSIITDTLLDKSNREFSHAENKT